MLESPRWVATSDAPLDSGDLLFLRSIQHFFSPAPAARGRRCARWHSHLAEGLDMSCSQPEIRIKALPSARPTARSTTHTRSRAATYTAAITTATFLRASKHLAGKEMR